MGRPFGEDTVKGLTGSFPECQQTQRWKELVLERNEQVLKARAYFSDLRRDGWEARPTYESEPVENAASLSRKGFKCLLISRPEGPRSLPHAGVDFWGPDGLQIEPPMPYSWEQLLVNMTKCQACKQTGHKTVRVAFAGRVCETCAPQERARLERPGWCD